MKNCFKCGEDKPRSEFYRHAKMADGLLGKCKDCTKSDARRNREENLEDRQAYDRERAKRRDRQAAVNKSNRERNPEKYRARTALNNAVRDGRIVKPDACACGSTEAIQGHHADYSKPLEVTWQCRKCHLTKEHGFTLTA